MARRTGKSRSKRRASRIQKPPNKRPKKLFPFLVRVLNVALWLLVLVVSYTLPGLGGLAKSVHRLIQVLLDNLDDDD